MSEIFDYCSRLNQKSIQCMEVVSELFEILLEFEQLAEKAEVKEFLENPNNKELVNQLNFHRESFKELITKMRLQPGRTDLI